MKIIIGFMLSMSVFASGTQILYKKKGSKDVYEKMDISSKNLRSIASVVDLMKKSKRYDFVETDEMQSELEPVSDNFKSLDGGWHHKNINTQAALDLLDKPHQVIIAVCDSGFEKNHRYLKGQSVKGHNFLDGSSDTSPNTNHGTMVSGLIVGLTNNEVNTSGIANHLKVMPLKITSRRGGSSTSRIADCIKYAADNGAKVVNVSFTGVNSRIIQSAGKYASDRGALLVYSAGNQGQRKKVKKYPDHKNVLIVGGTEVSNEKWNCGFRCGSNWGHNIDLVAPARNVFTTRANITFGGEEYSSPSGTSFSAPIVSAVAGLVYSVNPFFTAQEVEEILKQSALDLGNEYKHGAGLVDALKAVTIAITNK
jgi:subtilisin family serine protease